MYDYRQPASDDADDRSEITGFYSFPAGDTGKMQVYACGLSDGSPDWGAGVSFSAGFLVPRECTGDGGFGRRFPVSPRCGTGLRHGPLAMHRRVARVADSLD